MDSAEIPAETANAETMEIEEKSKMNQKQKRKKRPDFERNQLLGNSSSIPNPKRSNKLKYITENRSRGTQGIAGKKR